MPPSLRDLLDVIKLADLHDIFLVFHAARHAPRLHLKPGGVGHDSLLEADLRTIGEAGHHGRILFPFLGEALLRGGIAVRVLQALDVANDSRRKAQTLDPAIKIHLQARLIAVASREDHAMFFGIDLQDRSDGGIDLGVQQNDVLAVLERFEGDARAKLDRAGDIDEHIDFLGTRQQEGVFGDYGLAFADGEIDLVLLRGAQPHPSRRSRRTDRTPFALCGCKPPPSAFPVMVLTMWLPRPCDMKPAPIRATRMGRPSFSRAFNALSTRIMLKFLQH